MNSRKSKEKRKAVYYPRARFFVAYGVWPILILMTLYLLTNLFQNSFDIDTVSALLYGGVGIMLAWFSYQFGFYNRLIVWESGLEVYRNGTHLFIHWEELRRLGWFRGHKSERYWGIQHGKAERKAISRLGKLFEDHPGFIPLHPYIEFMYSSKEEKPTDAARFMQSPLVQHLLEYAPHLLEDEKAKHDEQLTDEPVADDWLIRYRQDMAEFEQAQNETKTQE